MGCGCSMSKAQGVDLWPWQSQLMRRPIELHSLASLSPLTHDRWTAQSSRGRPGTNAPSRPLNKRRVKARKKGGRRPVMAMAKLHEDALEPEQENRDMLQSEHSAYRLVDGKQATRRMHSIIDKGHEETESGMEEKGRSFLGTGLNRTGQQQTDHSSTRTGLDCIAEHQRQEAGR
jgi:hypothetical protein